MTTHFFDGERLVLDFQMMWVGASSNQEKPWAIHDTEGGEELFQTKDEAKARLARYAEEG